MNNAGITRIEITDRVSGAGAWRFATSRPYQPIANALYRDAFAQMGMPLALGDDSAKCTSKEFAAGHDIQYGVDLFLRFTSGMQASLQEKFLTTAYTTVTVEYYQNWRTEEPGDWFKLRVDYYFVGYHTGDRPFFDRWILLNWPAVQRATSQNRIPWQENKNRRDGARASFRYANFWDFPAECVIGGYWTPQGGGTTTTIAPADDYAEVEHDDLELDVLAHQQRYLYHTD